MKPGGKWRSGELTAAGALCLQLYCVRACVRAGGAHALVSVRACEHKQVGMCVGTCMCAYVCAHVHMHVCSFLL